MLQHADRATRSRRIRRAARMKLAIIPGFNVLVPAGQAGRRHVQEDAAVQPPRRDRLRRSPGPASARRTSRPPGAMFGIADQPGMTVGCVNPARPGAKDWVPLDSYWYARSPAIRCRAGRSAGRARARRRRLICAPRGWSRRKCVNDGPRGYLSIRTNADPKDKRTDRIGGEVGRRSACSCPAGACTWRTCRSPGRPHGGSGQRSIQNSCRCRALEL